LHGVRDLVEAVHVRGKSVHKNMFHHYEKENVAKPFVADDILMLSMQSLYVKAVDNSH
jgi:hypothetical protein